MVTIQSKVDLAAAFETLKERIKQAEDRRIADPDHGYAYAYGFLKSAVAGHIKECTGDSVYTADENPDDIKDINI